MSSDCDVAHFSDSELREQLTELGASPGPITGTTRKLWERRLVSLLELTPTPPYRTPTSPTSSPPRQEEEEEEEEKYSPPCKRARSPRSTGQSTEQHQASTSHDDRDTRVPHEPQTFHEQQLQSQQSFNEQQHLQWQVQTLAKENVELRARLTDATAHLSQNAGQLECASRRIGELDTERSRLAEHASRVDLEKSDLLALAGALSTKLTQADVRSRQLESLLERSAAASGTQLFLPPPPPP